MTTNRNQSYLDDWINTGSSNESLITGSDNDGEISVHWFRHGLRLHDNPALLQSLSNCSKFYPIFIFDGETAGLKVAGYNRAQFLLEALGDLNDQFKDNGGELFLCQGSPLEVLKIMKEKIGMTRLTIEQDCEAIWNSRDEAVKQFCQNMNVEVVECVSHTLWDPFKVIRANGGIPPLTYDMFLQVTKVLGLPPQPVSDPNFEQVNFGELSEELMIKLQVFPDIPTPEMIGYAQENDECSAYIGGERRALSHFRERLRIEEDAFREGLILPNQVSPDLLGPPMSMSAALRFGCLSVRLFYWDVQRIYFNLYKGSPAPTATLTAQLIWREFFYCMSANNPKYDQIEGNPICIDIPWYERSEMLAAFEAGQTGYPFIDACVRQMKKEGWIHHVCRTAIACFLTRGDLWISWEKGLQFCLRYLIDADWSVCAGNWMWVSSSAFAKQLDCSTCICPVRYGRRIEPTGDYIRRYVPELANMPQPFIFKPWHAPLEVQKEAGCILGTDYPNRIVIHKEASKENRKLMKEIRNKFKTPMPHCCPSNVNETKKFLCLTDSCYHNLE